MIEAEKGPTPSKKNYIKIVCRITINKISNVFEDGLFSFFFNGKVCDSTKSPGQHIHGEPGNQVPTKCMSSGKIFGRTNTMPQVDRSSLTKESKFF